MILKNKVPLTNYILATLSANIMALIFVGLAVFMITADAKGYGWVIFIAALCTKWIRLGPDEKL